MSSTGPPMQCIDIGGNHSLMSSYVTKYNQLIFDSVINTIQKVILNKYSIGVELAPSERLLNYVLWTAITNNFLQNLSKNFKEFKEIQFPCSLLILPLGSENVNPLFLVKRLQWPPGQPSSSTLSFLISLLITVILSPSLVLSVLLSVQVAFCPKWN